MDNETDNHWSTSRFQGFRRLLNVFSSSSPTLDRESSSSEVTRLDPESRQSSFDISSKTLPRRRGLKWLFEGHSRVKRHLLMDEQVDQKTTHFDDTVDHRNKMGGDITTTISNGISGESRPESDTSRSSDEQSLKPSGPIIKPSADAEKSQSATSPTNEAITWYDDVSTRRMKLNQFSSSLSNVQSTAHIGNRRPPTPTGNKTTTKGGKNDIENTVRRTKSGDYQQPATSLTSPVNGESSDLSWLAIERKSALRSTMSNVPPRPLRPPQPTASDWNASFPTATRSNSYCVFPSNNPQSVQRLTGVKSPDSGSRVVSAGGSQNRPQRESDGQGSAKQMPFTKSWGHHKSIVPTSYCISRPSVRMASYIQPLMQHKGNNSSGEEHVNGTDYVPSNTSSPSQNTVDVLSMDRCRRLEMMLSDCRAELLAVRDTMVRNELAQVRLFDDERTRWETERARLTMAAAINHVQGRTPRCDAGVNDDLARVSTLNRTYKSVRNQTSHINGYVADSKGWQQLQQQVARVKDSRVERKLHDEAATLKKPENEVLSSGKFNTLTRTLASTPKQRPSSAIIYTVSGINGMTSHGRMTSDVSGIRHSRQQSLDSNMILSRRTGTLEKVSGVLPMTLPASTDNHRPGNSPEWLSSFTSIVQDDDDGDDDADAEPRSDLISDVDFKPDSPVIDNLRLELRRCRSKYEAERRRWTDEKQVVVEYHLRLERHLAQTVKQNKKMTVQVEVLKSELARLGHSVPDIHPFSISDELTVEEMV